MRKRIRSRYQDRHGLAAPSGLTELAIDVNGMSRTYWLASPPPGNTNTAPMMLVLHGAGGQGPGMASLTGLDRRGPAAGFVTVFPDGEGRVWNDSRGAPSLRRREGIDDVGFLQALVAGLAAEGRGRADNVYLVGMSNGALMSEHVARHGLLSVAGLALVAGPGTEQARAEMPLPVHRATVVMFSGTADPLIPYAGGSIGFAKIAQRRDGGAGRGMAVAAETSAAEWAAANGIVGAPLVGRSTPPGDLPITLITWRPELQGPPVVLYRIEGGGHTWPGGAQYLPARLIGPTARLLDASGTLLSQFRQNENPNAY